MTITAAADGSALGNPGPAGWAWYVDEQHWASGGWAHGTNNMGELKAVLDLLHATADADEDLLIYCDSQYVINTVSTWMKGWKRNGWRKKDGKEPLNLDLIRDLDAAMVDRQVRFQWVKGHAGHPLNEAADRLAVAASTAYRGGREPESGPGFGTPRPAAVAVAAPADAPAAPQKRRVGDLIARAAERRDRASGLLAGLSPREQQLVREAAVLGFAAGRSAADEQPEPAEADVVERVLLGAEQHPQRYPTLGSVETDRLV